MPLTARRCLIGLACLFLALPAASQVFKSTMPDGRVIFGDKPEPNAARIEKFVAEPAAGDADPRLAEEERIRRQQEAEQVAQRLRERQASLDAAHEEMLAALRDLRAAQQRLEEGIEPAEGDRTGTAKGRSRLSPDYWERQENLKKEVQKQTGRLERAYQRLNELTR